MSDVYKRLYSFVVKKNVYISCTSIHIQMKKIVFAQTQTLLQKEVSDIRVFFRK